MEQPTPIVYPKIAIPGRGEVEVRFGLSAARIVDHELQLDQVECIKRLKAVFPTTENGVRVPGRIHPDFVLTLLSACTWHSAHMTPDEIAKAFDSAGDDVSALPKICIVLLEAFTKTKWSAQASGLQETATNPPSESTGHPLN